MSAIKILPLARQFIFKPQTLKNIRNHATSYQGIVLPGPATVNVSKVEIFGIGGLGMLLCYLVVYGSLASIPRWRGNQN